MSGYRYETGPQTGYRYEGEQSLTATENPLVDLEGVLPAAEQEDMPPILIIDEGGAQ